MGCDIHAFIECEYSDNNGELVSRKPFAELHLWREYRLFGYMAGVRNHDLTPLFEKRGLPLDVSTHIRRAYDEEDYFHGESWLTPNEYEKALQHLELNFPLALEEPRDIDVRLEYRGILATMRGLEAQGFKVRFIFWFDG